MPWTIATSNSEILAIHAALLPTNQVLMFGGSEHNAAQNLSGDASDLDNSRLFNVGGGTLIETIDSPDTDVFCSGHAFLADGRLLMAGGTEKWGVAGGHPVGEEEVHVHGLNFLGQRAAWVFHPRKTVGPKWLRVRDMHFAPGRSMGGGRWYPTLLTLANGEVLAVAGHPTIESGVPGENRHNNDTPERYSPGSDNWTLLTAERLDVNVLSRYYPRFHLLPDGNVFFVSPVNGASRIWNPFAGATVGATFGSPGGGLYDASWDFPSTLLPLLPEDGYSARVMICGDVNAKRINLAQASPAWQNTAARTGAAAGRQRRFACSVLLPTGDVFVTGGINGGSADANAVLEGEIYSPGIDWNTGQYTAAQTWTSTDAANIRRNYHSTALLLPNGRVWTAGSSRDAQQGDPINNVTILGVNYPNGVGEMTIELFLPPYDGNPARPQITDAPPSVGYGEIFEVRCPQTAQIRRVALTRCGSVTHAFDGDQRYVGLTFQRGEGDRLRVAAPPNSRIAPPGYYLLWVLDNNHLPCQEARFIRICSQRLQIILDRSTFSTHEVQALGVPGTTAVFSNALYVILDGFLPSEVGNPPTTPALTFTRPDGSAVPGMSAVLNRILYEDDTVPPDIAQRITFVFNVRFTSLQAFNEIPAADPAQNITVTARHGGNTEQAPMTLSKNPNPYMRDGEVHWLSTDVRVFTMRVGMTRAGVTLGAAADDPIIFIQQLLNTFNGTATDEDHPFFDIDPDPQASRLELASQVNGQPIFNFAVAKVRYRAPAGIDAGNVRVFFRIFNAAVTGLEYNGGLYARQGDGATAAPLLGLAGGEIASIPFFAEARQADMRNQVDPVNRRTIAGAGAAEVTAYFGCWLDFNQTTPRFPLNPSHNGNGGAFGGALLSIQQLVRNDHCCLVAEIHYPLDPIPNGATPGSHDNLSQRNLVIAESDNPGTAATHTVQSTFEIKPSLIPLVVPQAFGLLPPGPGVAAGRVAGVALAQRPAAVAQPAGLAHQPAAVHAQPLVVAAPRPRQPRLEADELMIRWNNLPRDSRVFLYLPDLDNRAIVAAAAARNGPPTLHAIDAETLVCRVGDVCFVPVPGPRALNIPGLISIELPPMVSRGQQFTITIHQVSGRPRRIIGSFQITIPVRSAAEILPRETRRLSVLRYIGLSIPVTNRWYKIWQRLLAQIVDRVRDLGGNPDQVPPSPTGEGQPDDHYPPGPCDGKPESATGEIARIIYDCNGRFESFVLRTCEGERVFSCERGIEEIVLKACRDHLQVTIWFGEGKVKRVAINCGS
jgi:Domain of unknown function (DUF1929)